MRNGAVLWRLNYLADKSVKGMKQSCGIMANYRYFLEKTDENSQKYLSNGVVKLGESVEKLIQTEKNSSKNSSKL